MKLSSLDQVQAEYSGQTSQNVRTFALGGIALVWALGVAIPEYELLPSALLGAGGLFLLSLTLDVIQYAYSWWWFVRAIRRYEKAGKKPDDPVTVDRGFLRRAEVIFVCKVILSLIGSVVLIGYMVDTLLSRF